MEHKKYRIPIYTGTKNQMPASPASTFPAAPACTASSQNIPQFNRRNSGRRPWHFLKLLKKYETEITVRPSDCAPIRPVRASHC